MGPTCHKRVGAKIYELLLELPLKIIAPENRSPYLKKLRPKVKAIAGDTLIAKHYIIGKKNWQHVSFIAKKK